MADPRRGERRAATRMMPLPTYQFPRHETESPLPAQTRQALRWEGVTGALPGVEAPSRLRRAWDRMTHRAPTPKRAPDALGLVPPPLRPEPPQQVQFVTKEKAAEPPAGRTARPRV